jgi:transcriptional/translational regulatory protein YebC/TACO1
MEAALEAGGDDVISDNDGAIEVLTSAEVLPAVVANMESRGLRPDQAELQQRASVSVPVRGADAEKMLQLLEALEDLDDVQSVFSNADFPDELLKQAS